MRFFNVFVLTKLFILDAVCGYLLYKLRKQKRELDHYVELQLLNDSRVKQLEHANMENELSARRLERRLNIMEGYRKRMYDPCNYGGHDWEVDGETDVKNVCGDYCEHFYHYVCKRCGKRKTTTKPLISRWEDEE